MLKLGTLFALSGGVRSWLLNLNWSLFLVSSFFWLTASIFDVQARISCRKASGSLVETIESALIFRGLELSKNFHNTISQMVEHLPLSQRLEAKRELAQAIKNTKWANEANTVDAIHFRLGVEIFSHPDLRESILFEAVAIHEFDHVIRRITNDPVYQEWITKHHERVRIQLEDYAIRAEWEYLRQIDPSLIQQELAMIRVHPRFSQDPVNVAMLEEARSPWEVYRQRMNRLGRYSVVEDDLMEREVNGSFSR